MDIKKIGKDINKKISDLQTLSTSQKIFFTQNLYVMIKAGLSLTMALETLSRQTKNDKLLKILKTLVKDVRAGNSFHKSLSRFPRDFPPLFTNMIKTGEVSGNLENVLKQLNTQIKKDHMIVSRVRSAMIYPSVVLLSMAGIGIMLIVYVIPNLLNIFSEIETELPMATRMLVFFSTAVTQKGIWLILALLILIGSFVYIIRTPKGKFYFHLILLKLPIINTIIIDINLARFSRTLGSLLKTDIPIVESVTITSKILGNVHYKSVLTEIAQTIQKGDKMAKSLMDKPKMFPPLVTQMIAVGEESGKLDELLEEIAVFYEQKVTTTMDNLSSILEPILIVLLGLAVGFMAVAVIMPMYSLTEQF